MSRRTIKRDDAQLLAEHAPGLLARLQVLTGALGGALTEDDVARVLVEHGVEALGAAAGVVAIDRGDGSLRVAASQGYPDELMERWREIPADAPVPIADSFRQGRPIFILSLEERDRMYPALAQEEATNRAFLVVPILLEDRALGALALSFAEPKALLDVDKTFMLAVAQQAAVSIERARLYDAERSARHLAEAATAGERAARAQAEKVRDQLSFLSEVSGVLAKSLDHRDAIAELGALAAGRIADWCAIDLVADAGSIERVVARHAETVALTPVEEKAVDWPIDPDLPVGSPAVIRSGRPELYPEISSSFADEISQDPTELEILRSIGITSALIVPIQARGRTLGAMTLVSTREDRHYDREDLDFAMLVALRAGVATDNARLYSAARRSDEDSRFQRLLLESQSEATIDGIRVVSADGHILFVNQRWRDMWGYGNEELMGMHEEDVLQRVIPLV
ncbi:MAG: GAF domain-containing protein, partial [Actinomycetota bacterium]